MILFLKALFSVILLCMIAVTSWASTYENVVAATARIVSDPWGAATMCDAYFGFLTFFVWLCYKESKNLARGLWFVGIMLFGNIAMSIYMLIQLFRLPKDASLDQLFLRKSA